MGLFGRKTTAAADDAPPTEVEGMVGVAVAAIYADGVITPEEDEDLEAYLGRMHLFRAMRDRDLGTVFQRVYARAREIGDARMLEASCAVIPERLRPTAFLMATDLLMGDEEFGDEERAFLAKLRGLLEIDDATAATITDVLAIKHRG